MAELLKVDAIESSYGESQVLFGMTLDIAQGEVVTLLGRNGMGKSTLIKVLSGLLPCHSGKIFLDNEDITNYPPHLRAQKKISTIVQGRGIFPRLQVIENLMLGKLLQTTVKKDRLDEVFGYFPILSERTNQVAGTLSGGEQQMLAIGRAIMSDPKIMLLDEPSDGIMPSLVKEIGSTLKNMSQKNSISLIVVEQNVPLIFSLTDHCIILEKGKIVVEGKKSEIQNSNIMKQYLAI